MTHSRRRLRKAEVAKLSGISSINRAIATQATGTDTMADAVSILTLAQKAGEIDALMLLAGHLTTGHLWTLPVSEAPASMSNRLWGHYRAAKATCAAPTDSVMLFSGAESRKPVHSLVLTTTNAVDSLAKVLAVEFAPCASTSPRARSSLRNSRPGSPQKKAICVSRHAHSMTAGRPEQIAVVAMTILPVNFVTGAVIDVDRGALLV